MNHESLIHDSPPFASSFPLGQPNEATRRSPGSSLVEDFHGGVECITVKGNALILRIPLQSYQLPLYAQLSAGGPCGICTSMYEPATHSWVVQQIPVVPRRGGGAELTVRLVVLNDSRRQYDVHVAMSSLEEACTIENLVALERRASVFQDLHISSHADRREEARAFCPVDGAVSLVCALPVDQGYQLCGGGFHSDYPVLAAQPTTSVTNPPIGYLEEEGSDKKKRTAEHSNELLVCDARPSSFSSSPSPALDGRGRVIRSTTSTKKRTGEGSSSLSAPSSTNNRPRNAWMVTATPNRGLACMAIGLRLREPSEWGEATGTGSETTSSPLYRVTAAPHVVSLDPSLSLHSTAEMADVGMWLTRRALRVEVEPSTATALTSKEEASGAGSCKSSLAFRIHIPFPEPQDFSLPVSTSTDLRDSLDFFYC